MLEAILDLFFPARCCSCSALLSGGKGPFCEGCELQVSPVPEPHCASCSEPLLPSAGKGVTRCPRCTTRPPPFASARAPFVHEGPLAHAIHRFKYEDHPELAAPLAPLMVPLLPAPPFLVAAIPLHASRFRSRRFDQAELLAQRVARLTRQPYVHGLLARTRATPRQVGLSETAREENLRGAFRPRRQVVHETVVLVDDVLTTGATARSACAALRAAGARAVHVVTLARAHSGLGELPPLAISSIPRSLLA